MALSDYLPNFSDPNQMALWGALGNVLVQGSTPHVGMSKMGAGNALLALGGAGMQGAGQGAQAAQAYKSSDQANQLNNFNLMYYRQANGLDPNTGLPVDQSQSVQPGVQTAQAVQAAPFGVPAQSPQIQAQGAQPQIPQMPMSQLTAPIQPSGAIPPPANPAQAALPPDMAKNAPAYGAMGGIGLPAFARAPSMSGAIGPYLNLMEKQTETGRRMDANGNIQVINGAPDAAAAMSQATEQGKVGPSNQMAAFKSAVEGQQNRETNAQRISLENASQKNVEDHKNYLEFGDNGMGGPGSILSAVSPNGANGGAPVPSQHGTMIPDVTEQTPIPRDANSLKAAIPAWQEKANTITDMVAPAQKAQVQLSAIADALRKTQSGSFATDKGSIKAGLAAAGINLPDSVWGDPASVQVAMHGAQLETLSDLKAANSRFSQMEFKTIIANKENPNTQPAANLEFLSQDLGAINQQLALANDWRSAQKMGWRNPQDFSTAWMTKNPQSRFVAGAKAKIGLLKGMQQ